MLRWFESTSAHFFFIYIAGWSSLEARRAHNPKVIGSNPIPATYAQIAQLVEQRTENPRVAGSIPALGIFFIWRKPRRIKGFRRFLMVEKSPRCAKSAQN